MELSKRKFITFKGSESKSSYDRFQNTIIKWGIVKLNNLHVSELVEVEFKNVYLNTEEFESFYCFAIGKKILLHERNNNGVIFKKIYKHWEDIKYEYVIMSNGNTYITIV
jgi:hypothetical protein